MDTDLIDEMIRLQRLYDERGLFAFSIECQESWLAPDGRLPRSPLFAFPSPNGREQRRPDGELLGCPIQIRHSWIYPNPLRFAWTDQWTDTLRNDERLPYFACQLRPHHLSALAQWQQTFRDYFRRRRCFMTQRIRKRKAMLRYSAGA